MSSPLSTSEVVAIRQAIEQWQQSHGRHQLPWQQEVTPYKVLVSELMLQQTQVATVIPYFTRWLTAFPDVQSLAGADEDDVMRLWQGLGYYARARNLQKAARYIAAQGSYPATLAEWLAVPGVGRYTAGAVLSFAYNSYGPIVDGNVRRVYARLFALEGVPNTPKLEKQLWQLAEQLTPAQGKTYAQGLLDLGATVCKPRQPLCEQCPLSTRCQALALNRVGDYPNPKPKKQVPTKAGHFLLQQQDDAVLLIKRPPAGIWPALWCLPQLAQAPENLALAGEFSHQFTHYKLNASVWLLRDQAQPAQQVLAQTTVAVTAQTLADYGLPAPVSSFLQSWFAGKA